MITLVVEAVTPLVIMLAVVLVVLAVINLVVINLVVVLVVVKIALADRKKLFKNPLTIPA